MSTLERYLNLAAFTSERVVHGYAGVYDRGGRPVVYAHQFACLAFPWGMLWYHRDDSPAVVWTWWGASDWIQQCRSWLFVGSMTITIAYGQESR